MLFVLVFFIFVLGIQSLAEEGFIPSQEELVQTTQQAIKLKNEANKLIRESLMEDTKKGCTSRLFKGEKDQSQGCSRSQTPPVSQHDKQAHILVFVSFSLPEASLKTLAQEARKYHATLVMRGLYQDSFVKTAQKLQELGMAVDIHPDLFETHHVTSVPTFVLMKDGQPLYQLKGNVTLRFVAEKFEEAS